MKRFSVLFLCLNALAAERSEVTGRMQVMFDALMNLQPNLVSVERYSDPKNKDSINESFKVLKSLQHAFPEKKENEEPGIANLSRLFSERIHDAHKRFNRGDYGYSRYRMKSIGAVCFQCHSRLATDKNFADVENRVANAEMAPYEKAEFYATTRQFDKALTEYKLLMLADPKSEVDYIRFARAMRHALGITVRVKRDAKETLTFVKGINERLALPTVLRNFTTQWKKDCESWIKEGNPKLTSAGKVKKAKGLIQRASELQMFPADENGDISYLRASNLLHEALESEPKGKFRGEALYLLGVSYYALQDPDLWDMDRMYFESCIRENPKTALSKKCFQRYSDKVYFGYTGSAGTFIPEDEADKLQELRKLTE